MTSSPRLSANERRRSILKAAVPLFASNGFNGTTTKQIAAAASVSEALLYKHFPSKEAIYAELEEICLAKDKLTEKVIHLEKGTQTLVQLVYLMITTIYKGDARLRGEGITHSHLQRLMINSYLEDGAFARLFINHNLSDWQDLFSACMRQAIANGDMLDDWIQPSARWWLAHHVGVAIGILNMPEEEVISYGFPREQLLDQAVRFALRGMGLSDQAITKYHNQENLERFRDELFGEKAEPVTQTHVLKKDR